ncbi:class A beta-lactamase-related serine hydrolase [Candidatus Parcubacteria bacterium]|nr:class A beta-lactamase-related serine hydrolase [Candidatus Parcubacteria bacterium]
MKQRLKFFRVGSKTYFHHQNGILIRKNRLRQSALNIFTILVVAGGFFGSYQYGFPALQSASYFRAKDVASQNIVSAEQEPNEPVQAPIIKEDELLKFALKQKIASFPASKDWSVYAYDLSSDRTVNINETEEYDAASLYKLFLLEALENKVAFNEWEHTYVDGKSLRVCAELMLQVNDDPCSESLAEHLNWEFIDQFNRQSGFEKTSLAGLEGRKTTAVEVGELFIRLKKGHTLSDNARRFVFDALYQQAYSKGISKGCGDCRTAVKAGELSGISHDGGIVTHGGKSYVLVVMSQGGSFEQISEITKLVDGRFGSQKPAL